MRRCGNGTVLLAVALATVTRVTCAFELIANGGFESGDFTGWNIANAGALQDTFIIDGSTSLPLSGNPTVGPATGSYYAANDGGNAGAHVLSQAFVVPPGMASVTLSFDMFVNDFSGMGPIIDPSGLDASGGPNQHARVDILALGADVFDTGTGVLANYYLSVDPGAPPHAYKHYQLDVTPVVGAGGTFVLRFAEVDNVQYLNVGVDNVSIDVATPTMPVTTTTTTLPPATGDAYKCYAGKDLKTPTFAKQTATLADALASGSAKVVKPVALCAPVGRDGAAIQNPDAYLCCYQIKAAKLSRVKVLVASALQKSQLQLAKPTQLCQPCTASVLR